ncbi:MAG TPA: hypothetical protein VK581_02385 [Chthoniobacterales bacterium]|nr:hypothetical protein [Chthoniobacterales bacterium]
MQTILNATICVNGNNYQSEDSMPDNIRQAFERVLSGALKARRSLFVGRTARFIPKLGSRIVCGNKEFSSVADMPSAQRKFYEDALAAILPGYIAVRVAESEARLQQRNKLMVALVSLAVSTTYLWFHGCLTDPKFFFHFLRFLCGLT